MSRIKNVLPLLGSPHNTASPRRGNTFCMRNLPPLGLFSSPVHRNSMAGFCDDILNGPNVFIQPFAQCLLYAILHAFLQNHRSPFQPEVSLLIQPQRRSTSKVVFFLGIVCQLCFSHLNSFHVFGQHANNMHATRTCKHRNGINIRNGTEWGLEPPNSVFRFPPRTAFASSGNSAHFPFSATLGHALMNNVAIGNSNSVQFFPPLTNGTLRVSPNRMSTTAPHVTLVSLRASLSPHILRIWRDLSSRIDSSPAIAARVTSPTHSAGKHTPTDEAGTKLLEVP